MRNLSKPFWDNYDLLKNILKIYYFLAMAILMTVLVIGLFNAEMFDQILFLLLP